MKLKKIASLALAGIMAVSMLAGCSNGENNNGGNSGDDNTVITPSTTPVVDAVNKGQDVTNDVKITFTADSKLDAALQKAVSVYGTDSTTAELKNAIYNMTGLKDVLAYQEEKFYQKAPELLFDGAFLNGKFEYGHSTYDPDHDLNGKVYTIFNVEEITSANALSEEAALNVVAEKADSLIAQLAKTSKEVQTGEKYYSYSYDGNISMVSVTAIDGTTNYYVAYVVNQTVTEKTL